ncbi:hypothetical protein HPB49_016126 [Dermacentor silvarum]|uniref:Uncharacterized protein n=1 Tax=Dermacentor silvarum TaxID=543639 RepID=A0ACB8CG05_DERSI|nr:hypothetical protein HPB49_016126 [Dermacentor silvarum]
MLPVWHAGPQSGCVPQPGRSAVCSLRCECEHHPVRPNEAQLSTQVPHLRRKPLHWLCGVCGKIQEGMEAHSTPAETWTTGTPQTRGTSTSREWRKKATEFQAKEDWTPQTEQCTGRAEVEAAYFQAGDFPPLVSPQQKAPPRTEPESMQATASSDEEQEPGSDL